MTPEETRRRILQSAAKAFAKSGFRACSIKEIARLACVNDVTVYRHFPKKRDLYRNAVDWKLGTLHLSNVFDASLDAPPAETLRGFARRVLEGLNDDPEMVRLIYFAALELGAEKSQLCRAHLRPLLLLLEEQVRAWITKGQIREIDPESAAMNILGPLASHCSVYKLFGAPQEDARSVDEIASEYAEMCLAGLGAAATR
jgi:AcrR family transcriptional regulator